MSSTVFRLTVPAEPAAVRVIRSVASAAGAEAALAYDSLDDLALAIDEASGALLADDRGGTLHCDAHRDGTSLAIAMSVSPSRDVVPGAWPADGWRDSLGAMVLAAVASNIEYSAASGRPTISFTVG